MMETTRWRSMGAGQTEFDGVITGQAGFACRRRWDGGDLTANNTYTGQSTNVQSGSTLICTGTAPLPTATSVDVSTGGLLEWTNSAAASTDSIQILQMDGGTFEMINGSGDTSSLTLIQGAYMDAGSVLLGSGATLALGSDVVGRAASTTPSIAGAGGSLGTGTLALGTGTRTFTVHQGTSGDDLSISVPITGTAGLSKTGEGTMVLSGASTYSGTTIVNGGTLVVGADAPNGAPGPLGDATSAVVLQSEYGSTIATLVTDGAFTIARPIDAEPGFGTIGTSLGSTAASTSTFSGPITLDNALTLTSVSGGTVDLTGVISGTANLIASGGGTVDLSGTNTYSGVTYVYGGTLVAGSNAPNGAAGSLGDATTPVYVGYWTGSSSSSLVSGGPFTIARPITVQSGSTGTVTLGGITTDTSTFSGPIVLNNAVTLTAASGGTDNFTGVVSGSGGVNVFSAGGAVGLSNSNTYTGGTAVLSGTLLVGSNAPRGSAGALGASTSAVLLGATSGSSNAALETAGGFTIAMPIAVQSGGSGTETLGERVGGHVDVQRQRGHAEQHRHVIGRLGRNGKLLRTHRWKRRGDHLGRRHGWLYRLPVQRVRRHDDRRTGIS